MTLSIRVLAIIPARGGSKRIPEKNIVPLAGKPLIAWTIETALDCPRIDHTLVTTDDAQIAELAQSLGADVPFIRPPALAQDETPDRPVYDHAISYMREQEGTSVEIVVWLRPTTPLRRSADITQAIEQLQDNNFDVVRSVTQVSQHPYWMKTRHPNGEIKAFIPGKDETSYPRSQLLPPLYYLNGVVDVVRCASVAGRTALFGGENVGSVVIPSERSIDIDIPEDLEYARYLVSKLT